MNKNGFTLIELIITIALIGFVGVILSINVVKTINDQKEENTKNLESLIEETACGYASLSTSNCDTGCTITGETLINEGLIEEEGNGIAVIDYSVTVSYQDGERICDATK